jgi:hypothetical protein
VTPNRNRAFVVAIAGIAGIVIITVTTIIATTMRGTC